MKTLFTAILTILTITIFAQNTVSWLGGTPGRETTWNEARNWSNYQVPDLFSNVLIADVSTTTRSYPLIKNGAIVELNSISIESDAKLCVEEGAQLIINSHAVGLDKNKPFFKGLVFILTDDAQQVYLSAQEKADSLKNHQ